MKEYVKIVVISALKVLNAQIQSLGVNVGFSHMFFVISGKEETANFYYFLIGWSVLVMAVMLFAEIWNQYKEREEAFIYN